MSVCRFSSMNWRCDVYVYEDVSGGWTTHVANRRRALPPIPDLFGNRFSMWLHDWSGYKWDREQRKDVYPYRWRGFLYRAWSRLTAWWHNCLHMGSLKVIPLITINLPFAGEQFNDATASDCAERLEQLLALGYRVPPDAIETLRDVADED